MDDATPPREESRITARVTVSGETADYLRALARVEDRTPEEMVQEWIAGRVVIPATPATPADWALFSGPADLSQRAGDLEGFAPRRVGERQLVVLPAEF